MSASSTWPPPSEGDWRLPSDLVEMIYAEILAPLSDSADPRLFHNELQRRLKRLGESLGYKAKLEYPTPYIDKNRSGRVDVVWDGLGLRRSIAIEIDRTWKQNSISKLLYMSETHQPVWIFLGARAVPFVAEGDLMRRVHLLRIDPAKIPAYTPVSRLSPEAVKLRAIRGAMWRRKRAKRKRSSRA